MGWTSLFSYQRQLTVCQILCLSQESQSPPFVLHLEQGVAPYNFRNTSLRPAFGGLICIENDAKVIGIRWHLLECKALIVQYLKETAGNVGEHEFASTL